MIENKASIAVLVSGGGTNLQAIIDAQKSGIIKNGKVQLVISNNENAYAIKRAKDADITTEVVLKRECGSQAVFENRICELLEEHKIDLIVLAGFMSILSAGFTSKYEKRIINIHPSLIPSFCGEGFYGLKVHETALERGVKITGATVHYVNEIPDGGEIIAQRPVAVLEGDTPQILQKRVMEQAEWIILPQAVEMISAQILEERRE